ncbi:Calcium-dependent protein kinase SK5 [Bienertia sinuspersici]
MPFNKTNSVRFSKPTSVLPYETKKLHDLYTLGKILGQGQYGTTYLCTEISTGAEYACKTIPKRKLLCREDCDDVWREIQIMHHLVEHPNVVTIKGTYEDSSHVHLVMELCEGGELFDRIVAKGQYTEREAARLMKTIMGVVETCHSLGVIHRDLKPENFLFESSAEDSSLKATDFGLSVFYQPGDTFNDVVGSPFYVAPEVLCKLYGPEADVWSAETDTGIFKQILKGKLDFETRPWPSISEGAKDLIRKMLERDPRQRLTAYQVLNKPLDSAVLSRLKHFSAMNKLKKMACRLSGLSEEEIGGLKEDGLRRNDSKIRESEIEDLMHALEREENLASAFAYFDKDGSGYITIEELQQACKDLGLSDLHLEEMIKEIDQDDDGQIDYGEFVAMMRMGNGGGGRRTMRSIIKCEDAVFLQDS